MGVTVGMPWSRTTLSIQADSLDGCAYKPVYCLLPADDIGPEGLPRQTQQARTGTGAVGVTAPRAYPCPLQVVSGYIYLACLKTRRVSPTSTRSPSKRRWRVMTSPFTLVGFLAARS